MAIGISSKVSKDNIDQILLTNKTTGEKIDFYGLIPENFQDQHQATWADDTIATRSSPVFHFNGGSARSTSLTFTVHEDYLIAASGDPSKKPGKGQVKDTIVEFVNKLEALTFPKYTGTKYEPPLLLLEIGTFFKMYGFCNDFSANWQPPVRNGRFIVCEVTISITEALKKAYSMTDFLGSSPQNLNNYPDFYN